ncbi:MAG: alkaline phosphatase family protein, partial [Aquiluna sp.]
MFKSAHDATIGKPNALALPARKSIVVCLIDGLGAQQLRERSGHASFLSSALKLSSIITCAYPATTSVNIGSFATGLTPGQHGLIGHQVWDRRHDERINLLVGW